MTAVLGLCAASASAGAILAFTGWRAGRSDVVSRGLGDRAPRRKTSPLDAALERWSRWLGWDQQAECLHVLGESMRRYRRRQLRVLAAVTVVATFVALTQGLTPVLAGWAVVAVPASLLAVEKDLHRRAARRRALLGEQVSAAGEHLALAVTAGITVAEALARAAAATPPPLGPYLSRVHAEVRTGRTLHTALVDAAAALGVPEFTRLADTLVTSSERGVPLADVLIAQAGDARVRRRTLQLERAGRAEIAMLLPIVLLVLPCVVVVAVFPGAQVLGSM